MERAEEASSNAAKHRKTNLPVHGSRPVSTEASPRQGRYVVPARRRDVDALAHTSEEGNLDSNAADLDVISNSGRKQVVETSVTDSDNLAYNATLSENNSTFGSGATKLVINETMEVTGEKYSSSVELGSTDTSEVDVLAYKTAAILRYADTPPIRVSAACPLFPN
ncbi:hypothetical protein ACQ4PT_012059 [Festuca glaucescens]